MGESLCDRFALEGFAFDWHQDGEQRPAPHRSRALRRRDQRCAAARPVAARSCFAGCSRDGAPLPPFLFITGVRLDRSRGGGAQARRGRLHHQAVRHRAAHRQDSRVLIGSRRAHPPVSEDGARRVAGHAPDRGDAAAHRRARRDRAHHRRVGRRQGTWSRSCSTPALGGARRRRSSRSTAPRCPRRCSSRSCSATSAARSPARCAPRRACSSRPTAARCSSTRSARCRRRCRPSCCGRCRSGEITRVGGEKTLTVTSA